MEITTHSCLLYGIHQPPGPRSSAPKTRIDQKKLGNTSPKNIKNHHQILETLWEISNWGLLYLKFSGEKNWTWRLR